MQGKKPKLDWFGLALAVVVAAALRFWHLTLASQHTDEAFTFALGALPVPALIAQVAAHDFHPPLFYLLTHALMVWLPKPQWDYRVITAAFGCLTVIAAWGAARRMFGPLAAVVAAMTVALAPALVQYDRIYRMYAVTVALSTLSFWLLVELEQAGGTKRRWLTAGYAIAALALPYVDYLGGLVLLAQLAYAVTRRPLLWAAIACISASAIAFVPWLGSLREQLPLGGMALSRPGLDLGLAASLSGAFASGTPAAWLNWPGGAFLPAFAVGCLVVAGMWLGRGTPLPFWLFVLPAQIAGSLALGKNLAYFSRYLLIDVPPVCISLGLVASRFVSLRAGLVAGAGVAAVVAFLCVNAANVLLDPYYQFPDWYAVNALMLKAERPTDAIVLDAGYEGLVVRDFTAFRGRTLLSFMNPSDFDPILTWIARHPARRVWYIEHQHYYWDPNRRIAAALGKRRNPLLAGAWPHRWPVDNVAVVLFDKVPMKSR